MPIVRLPGPGPKFIFFILQVLAVLGVLVLLRSLFSVEQELNKLQDENDLKNLDIKSSNQQ